MRFTAWIRTQITGLSACLFGNILESRVKGSQPLPAADVANRQSDYRLFFRIVNSRDNTFLRTPEKCGKNRINLRLQYQSAVVCPLFRPSLPMVANCMPRPLANVAYTIFTPEHLSPAVLYRYLYLTAYGVTAYITPPATK